MLIHHYHTFTMPRRTAWASQVELAELYDMIYAPHADDQSRHKALSRVSSSSLCVFLETPLTVPQMSIYLSSPSCPSFIYLLHSLLSADLLPIVGAAQIQSTRLSCAMAIVRFINGMVDPLQTGMWSRELYGIHADWIRTLCTPNITYRRITQNPSIPYLSPS